VVDGDEHASQGRHSDTPLDWHETRVVAVCGLIGGFFASYLGCGADMMAYTAGFILSSNSKPQNVMSESMLTASSVIIMASISVAGVIINSLTMAPDGVGYDVRLCWAATVPIVVIGAPIGSYVLSPRMVNILKNTFYFLAAFQLATFGILKIQDDLSLWALVIVSLFCTVGSLMVHHRYRNETLEETKEKVEAGEPQV